MCKANNFITLNSLIIYRYRLNLCRNNANETHELCLKVCSDVLAKYLAEAPPAFYHMVSVITYGLWYIDVTLNTDALLTFIYQLHGIECKYLIFHTLIIFYAIYLINHF